MLLCWQRYTKMHSTVPHIICICDPVVNMKYMKYSKYISELIFIIYFPQVTLRPQQNFDCSDREFKSVTRLTQK